MRSTGSPSRQEMLVAFAQSGTGSEGKWLVSEGSAHPAGRLDVLSLFSC